ncbi:MAG: RNA polymerase sigma factor [Labilithrix sp.]|nr:RNA polymerase sigma factor [Labilithrix sp.]
MVPARTCTSATHSLEGGLLAVHAAGDFTTTFERLLGAYGAEINGFVNALLRSPEASADVCAQIWGDVWRDLPSFRGDASFRTWVYVIARHACLRFRARSPQRRECSLSEARTSQLVYLHPTRPSPTETRRERFARLRAELSDDEQALLVLRVDRALAWEDIARILYGETEDASVERLTAALRKRFERLKERLRARLREEEP